MQFRLAFSPDAYPNAWRAAFAVCIIGNIIWYLAKFVLKAHGFPVSFIWHLFDLPNLYRLVRHESDPAARIRYLSLLLALYTSVAVFVALAIYLFTRP